MHARTLASLALTLAIVACSAGDSKFGDAKVQHKGIRRSNGVLDVKMAQPIGYAILST